MLSKATVSVPLIALALAAGCGQSSSDKAKSQVCDARDDIGQQVKQLQSLTLATVTTSKVSDGVNAIKKDLSTISDATPKLAQSFKADVKTANDQFKTSVQNTAGSLGKTTSVQSAATQFKTAVDQLSTSYKDTFAKLKC
jgi:hypothetical protein